jgi:hypothetical protein
LRKNLFFGLYLLKILKNASEPFRDFCQFHGPFCYY